MQPIRNPRSRVGSGNELQADEQITDAADPDDRDAPVLERLAQRLEDVLLELR
jgi:hypothetical protein